jgi:hypothetical protein
MNRECTDLEFNLNPSIELSQLAFIPFKFNLLASFTRGISGGLSQFRDFAIISLNFRYSLSPLLWGLPSFVNFTRSSFKPELHPWPPSTSLYSPSLVISAQSARTIPTLGRVTLQLLFQLRSQRTSPLSHQPCYETAQIRSHHQRSTTSLVG